MSEAKKNEMKFNPDLSDLLKHTSRYSLVIATAKRARAITDDAAERKESLIEKPVSLALNEFLNGEYIFPESEEVQND